MFILAVFLFLFVLVPSTMQRVQFLGFCPGINVCFLYSVLSLKIAFRRLRVGIFTENPVKFHESIPLKSSILDGHYSTKVVLHATNGHKNSLCLSANPRTTSYVFISFCFTN